MDNRLTTHKTQIPEWKIQFFESVDNLRENTVNNTKEILSDKEKFINLLELFNETFSLREMATILKIDRKTLSIYIKKKEIIEEKSTLLLENKEETILENIQKRENINKNFNKKYLKMQEKLAFFNSKIPEKDLCILLNLKLPTLMAYKKWPIRQIWEDALDNLLISIEKIKNDYLEKIEYLKAEIEKLINNWKTKIYIHNFLKISETSFYNFISWLNLRYNYLENAILILNNIKKEKEIRMKKEEEIRMKKEEEEENTFFINFFKWKEESDFTNRLLKLTLPSNRRKLLLNWYNIKDNIEILYKTRDFWELEKIEKLLI